MVEGKAWRQEYSRVKGQKQNYLTGKGMLGHQLSQGKQGINHDMKKMSTLKFGE